MFDIQKNYKDCMQNSEEIQIPVMVTKLMVFGTMFRSAKQDITNKLRAHLELTK